MERGMLITTEKNNKTQPHWSGAGEGQGRGIHDLSLLELFLGTLPSC